MTNIPFTNLAAQPVNVTLDAGIRILTGQHGTETPPAEGRTWTLAIEGGGQISGYRPPWAEHSSTDDSNKPLRADRLEQLVDLDHWTSFDGVELMVDGPGFGDPAEVEDVFRGQLQVRPFDSAPAERVPHVDLEVVENRWMTALGPDELAGVISSLRAQADRLEQVHAQLVAARADWAEHVK